MIQSIDIQNFQSHKDTKLVLSPGVNIIVGPSDSGKSAIFRALLWNLFNRPLGDAFRSNWGGMTNVMIKFNDGVITRTKGDQHNHYIVGETTLKAFGQEVPIEVLDAHNLDRSLNIQAQIDPFFLLQSSPGEVAKYFNQIAGLEGIDRLTKGLASHHRKVKQELSSAEQHLVGLKEDLRGYDGLDEIGEKITQAEQVQKDLDQVINYRNVLSSQLSRLQARKQALQQAKEKLRVKEPLDKALALYDQLDSLNEQIEGHQGRKDRIVQHIKTLTARKVQLAEMRKRFAKVMPKICPLCDQEIKS